MSTRRMVRATLSMRKSGLTARIPAVRLVSIITRQPVREETRVGTKVIPGYGTGTFRWPVDNPSITCRWGCYSGHQAIDIKNSYNRYGNLYAADRGTIAETGYTSINGYYQIIDHNNGYKTYYGHMNRPAFFKVGQNVEKGEIIGQIGMTGRDATGPHVHFFMKTASETQCNGWPPDRLDGILPCWRANSCKGNCFVLKTAATLIVIDCVILAFYLTRKFSHDRCRLSEHRGTVGHPWSPRPYKPAWHVFRALKPMRLFGLETARISTGSSPIRHFPGGIS